MILYISNKATPKRYNSLSRKVKGIDKKIFLILIKKSKIAARISKIVLKVLYITFKYLRRP
jgi:hypothetical protein